MVSFEKKDSLSRFGQVVAGGTSVDTGTDDNVVEFHVLVSFLRGLNGGQLRWSVVPLLWELVDAREELLGAFLSWVFKHRCRVADLHDLPIGHEHHYIGDFTSEAEFVSDYQHRHS